MSKSSRLNLYAFNNISKKSLLVDATDARTQFYAPDKIELHAPVVSIQGGSTPENIDNLASYLYTEKTTKDSKNAEQDGLISNLGAALAAEAVNRQSADTSLQGSITAETDARTTADNTLNAAIGQEVQDRAAADSTLTGSINQEITDRISAVSLVSASVAASARAAAVSAVDAKVEAITAGSSVDLDTLIEIVNAYQNADTNILTAIQTLQSSQSTLQTRLDSLTEGGV